MVSSYLPYGGPASLPTRPLRRGFFRPSSLLPRRVFLSPRERLIPECSRFDFLLTTLFHSRDSTGSYRLELQCRLRETVTSLLRAMSWLRLPVVPLRASVELLRG